MGGMASRRRCGIMKPTPTPTFPMETRPAFTWKSALFGLAGLLAMASLAGHQDSVCFYGPHMVGNHLPGGALTYVVFLGLVWNGLVGRLSRRLALGPKELAVVLCITLMGCFPPSSGLFRYATRIIMLPWYYLPGRPEWAEHGLLEMIEPALFPAPGPSAALAAPGSATQVAYQRVYQGYFSGLAQGTHWLPPWEIPFGAWLRPLAYWGPLVFLLSLACVALQFVVHRQWSRHEQLGYPVAQVMGGFCARADGRPGVPDIFRSRLFWWGFVPVFTYYLLDFLGLKFPETFPRMSHAFPALRSWWLPVYQAFPVVRRSTYNGLLNGQTLYFTIVGAAYFVSTEISLTMGLAPLMLVLFGIAYHLAVGRPVAPEQINASSGGAYLGYALILLYTGRTYFAALARRAAGLRPRAGAGPSVDIDGDDGAAVLAARVFVLAILGEMAVLHLMGFEWPLAILFALMVHVVFLIFTRIICETGIPFLGTDWSEFEMLVSLVGPATVGPKGLVMGNWLHNVLLVDPRECLMPYVASAAKIAEDRGLRLRRVFWLLVGCVALALLVAFGATMFTHYNLGALATSDNFAPYGASTRAFDVSARLVRDLKDVGDFEASCAGGFLGRLGLARPDPQTTPFFLGGIAIVVALSMVRFKFARFPIHPVAFMVWGSYACGVCWGSFLVGWFAKTLVVRFGGGRAYQELKPVFIGILAGETVFLGLHVLYNLVYLFLNGTAPAASISVMPI